MSSKIDDARKEVIDFITKKLENENSVPWRDPCFNLTCKKSPPSIGGEMNCGFFCGFDALRKTIAL